MLFRSRHTNKITEDRFNRMLMEMCDVTAIANQPIQYHHTLKEHYLQRILPEEKRRKRVNPREFNMDDPEQGRKAAQIMASALAQKAKLMGLAGGRK